MNTEPLCLLVVITYRSAATVAGTVATIDDWLRRGERRAAVLLDNSNDQECVDIARRTVGAAVADRFVAEVAPGNLGFSFGVNRAVETGRARWGEPEVVVLNNPDVVTSASVIEGVVALLSEQPDIGVSAPVLRACDGSVDGGAARRVWNRRRLFAELVGVPGIARLLGTPVRAVDVTGPGLHDVDFTSGAYMAIRGDVFGAGLDTRLPMYLEDQEISRRAHEMGLRVVVSGALSAEHVGGVSRRSNTAQRRQLRLMELVVAPCISLADTARVSERSLRLLVAAGGVGRALLAVPAAVRRPSGRRAWLRDQLTLSTWFLSWASTPGPVGAVHWDGTAPTGTR